VSALRIVRILAPNPGVFTLEGTNTWIVGDAPAFVIDPGPEIAEHLDEVVASAGAVAHVILTHDHEDHAAAARALGERTGARVWAWRLDGAEHMKDGASLSAGGAELVALHTPGHSADHLVLFEPTERGLFTGDAVLGRGTSLIDPPDGDLAKYLASLRRMVDLHPRTIYPGHGPVVLDAPGKLRGYLDHRQERERQVLAGLADGARTVDALVAAIYADQPDEVRPLAARTVTAHLRKLESEGRAEKRGRGATQTWQAAEPHTCARCGRPVTGRARYCGPCSLALLQGADDAGA
jgi:glyoxylase-like metal-dependent hydrolase (beta-lactamase superfamily II)